MTGHVTVLLDEVVAALGGAREGWIVDGTVGQGGHAEALLDATPSAVRLLGLDRDPQAVDASRARLARFGERAVVLHRGYDELADVQAELGCGPAAGIVLDLGLSSVQLASDRGFSFAADAPLDMRFDPTSGKTAAELIHELAEADLERVLKDWGEIPASRRLARRLKDDARRGRMETTSQFAAACVSVLGPRVRKIASPTLPAQALRILVNRELTRLDTFLERVPDVTAPGGGVAVIAFHSLEDRRVKHAFQGLVRQGGWSQPQRKPVRPGEAETYANRRARSAKLRVVVRDVEVPS